MSNQTIKPPNNIDAERSVLSSILIDREALIKAAEMLRTDDFYDPVHQTIFGCCVELFEQSSAVDIVTVKSHLSKTNKLNSIGGTKFLSELVSILPITTNVEYYSRIIKESSLRRRIVNLSSDFVQMGMDESRKIEEILDDVEKKVFSISQKTISQGFSHIKDIIAEHTQRYEEMQKNPGGIRGIPTPYDSINKMLGGFHKGDLVIIAARPSVGKTSFMLDIARHMAVAEKKKVLIFSLEMGKDQLADRLISMQGQVDLMNIKSGNLYGEDDARYHEALGVLYDADLFIDDKPGQHIAELRTKCRRWDLEVGIDAIFIDYLQLLHGSRGTKESNRALEVSEISQSLKNIARELQVPVIALSQLNRGVESRNDRRPQLSDLRESGSIEQDADIVIFLHREAMFNRDLEGEERDRAQIIISKHRNGATGQIEMKFVGEQARYEDIEQPA